MSMKKAVAFLLLLIFLFVGSLLSPLIFEDYILHREAQKLQQEFFKNPHLSRLRVASSNRKFKGLVIDGKVTNKTELEYLEQYLSAYPGFNFSIAINVDGKIHSKYIRNVYAKK
jgi:hypothetical protein